MNVDRRRRCTLAVAAVACALAALPGRALGADESTAYQAGVGHIGSVAGSVLKPPLERMWVKDLAGPPSYPLIANGRAFATVGNGSGGLIYGIDLATGATLWSRTTGTNWAAATYENGQVFVVDGNGLLRGLSAATGATLWATALPGQYSFTAAPTAFQGKVYVGGAGSGGTLYAVNETDGTVAWTRPVANGDVSSPALDSSRVYVSYVGPQIYAFDRVTGVPAWHYSGCCSGGGGSNPVLYGNRLFTRDSGSGYVLDSGDGHLLDDFSSTTPPAFADGVGLYMTGPGVRAEDASTGSGLWNFSGDGALDSAPFAVNGYAYLGSSKGDLYAVNLSTGAAVWSQNLGAAISGPNEYFGRPSGLGSGGGVLVAPAGNSLVALHSAPLGAGYPRPRGATPFRVPLVPAYAPCGSPGSTHGAPLAYPSCKPPAQASSVLTVGTSDANGASENALGSVLLSVNTRSPDVAIDVATTDVRCKLPSSTTCGSANDAAGPDYSGQLRASINVRLTDKLNGPGLSEPATVEDFPFVANVACTPTADPTIGSRCAISTTANALAAGSVNAGMRAVWQMEPVQIYDGGPDGNASTANNTLFEDQGVFIP
jgi:outer membrane protein assembly factor BamB